MSDIQEAFRLVPRSEFLPENVQANALEDRPLSIGYNQTNSQPSTVRRMLEWLNVQPGDKILDVGSGSGWTTALLAQLTGDRGKVEATERIPELVAFGQENCKRLGIKNVTFHAATNTLGWPPAAPYDRILVSAGANELPAQLLGQLKTGATSKMVIPVEDEILEVSVDEDGKIYTIHHPGFLFVPLWPLHPQ